MNKHHFADANYSIICWLMLTRLMLNG